MTEDEIKEIKQRLDKIVPNSIECQLRDDLITYGACIEKEGKRISPLDTYLNNSALTVIGGAK